MAKTREEKNEHMHARALSVAAELFLTQGYEATTVREISARTGISTGSLVHLFGTKEGVLCELVDFVLEGQFKAAGGFLAGITDDKLLFWAAETTLQLHMAESSEQVREIYLAAYSLPKTSEIIYKTIAGKMTHYFGDLHPAFEEKDFYEMEIASGGIMRGFISVPCDMYFTMDRKVRRFLETAFLIYRVPDEKIEEAIEFVQQFDYPALAQQIINGMLERLRQGSLGSS